MSDTMNNFYFVYNGDISRIIYFLVMLLEMSSQIQTHLKKDLAFYAFVIKQTLMWLVVLFDDQNKLECSNVTL